MTTAPDPSTVQVDGPLPRAVMTASCSCGRGEPFTDEDLSLTDVPRIKAWSMLHDAAGHVVTITVVVQGGQSAAPASFGARLRRVLGI